MVERTRSSGQAQDVPVPSLADQRDASAYDEKQVAEILQRAAGLDQKKRFERPVLTLQEIEAIARDAGIDPAMVAVAARDLALKHQEQGLGSRLAGAPLRRTIERVVDGEISTDEHELLANDIREALAGTGMPAQIATLGRSLSMSMFTRGGLIDVQVSPKNGKTHIRITVNAVQLAGGLFGGLMGGIGGGLGGNVAWIVPTVLATQLHAPAVACVAGGAAALLGVVGGAYGLARALFSRSVGSTHRRMEQLADTLEGHLREVLARRPSLPG